MEDTENMTYRQFINSFLLYRPNDSVELKLAYHLGISIDSPEIEKLKWLGIFEDIQIGLKDATPAQILQHILEQKWGLDPEDKDMIVMLHRFEYSPTPALPKGRESQRSKNKKFTTKRLKQLFLNMQDNNMGEQKEILEKAFNDWKGDEEQVDDVLVIGVRV